MLHCVETSTVEKRCEKSCCRSLRLFADDCLVYRPITSDNDAEEPQKELAQLETWADQWVMKFNAKKCYILNVNNNGYQYFYPLGNHILQNVEEKPY